MKSPHSPDDDRDHSMRGTDSHSPQPQHADAWINLRLDRDPTTTVPTEVADLFPRDETAATSAAAARLDGSPNENRDVPPFDAEQRRRVADLQLLDALLASRQPSRKQAVQQALAAALVRLDTQAAQATHATHAAYATQSPSLTSTRVEDPHASAELPRSRRSNWPARRRVLAWFGAVSAVAALALVGWQFDKSRSAYAMVTRWERQATVALDRSYRLTIEPAVPLATRREAKFYVRGGRQFVFDDPGPLGVRLLFGSDGQRRWRIASGGPAYWPESRPRPDSPDRTADNSRHGAPTDDAPYLRLDSLLARMRDHYELRSDRRTRLNENGPTCDHVSARLAETTSGMNSIWPSSVEIWAATATGVVQRLELRWPSGSLPVGPRSLVFELDSERPLGDRFFEAEFQWESLQ